MSRKEELERLEKEALQAATALRGQEYIWQAQWESAPNPFVAIDEWRKNSPKRMKYITPWLEARRKVDKFKER